MSLLSQKFKFLRKKDVSPSGHQITEEGGREWENFYRDRWSYDKVVRTTHGVNCTGSCSCTYPIGLCLLYVSFLDHCRRY